MSGSVLAGSVAFGLPSSVSTVLSVPLAETAALDLVLPSQRHGMRRTIEKFAQSRGVTPNVVVEIDALAQTKEWVGRGGGFTILAVAAARDRTKSGEFVSSLIVEPVIARPIYPVRKRAWPQAYVGREVERITLDVINDLVARGIWKVIQKTDA